MLVWSDPEPDAVGVPRGVVTNAQHVLVQLTRLPTTVAHAMSTGTFGVSPDAVSATLVSTGPRVDARLAVTPSPLPDSPACCSVVIALIVGATFAGQSICGFGASVPFVTLNLKVERKSTRLNSSHLVISYAVFCLKNNR